MRLFFPKFDHVCWVVVGVVCALWFTIGLAQAQLPFNGTLTDVPGVTVGHVTFRSDKPVRVRTGVTAIVPDFSAIGDGQGALSTHALPASAVVHSGNGVLTGLSFIQDVGLLSGPIILTNTESVGTAYTAVREYMRKVNDAPWEGGLPVVAECWDGVFHTIDQTPTTSADVIQAIHTAHTGPVEQGRVGAGTGMRAFELHAGIGSASQSVTIGGQTYILGVLVNMNHSHFEDLSPGFRSALEQQLGNLEHHRAQDAQDRVPSRQVKVTEVPDRTFRQGSIVTVIATDAPLLPHQLRLLAQRAWLGVGRTGAIGATHSGDFTLAFSTHQAVSLVTDEPYSTAALPTHQLNPLFHTVIDLVEQAQRHAIVASHRPIPSGP